MWSFLPFLPALHLPNLLHPEALLKDEAECSIRRLWGPYSPWFTSSSSVPPLPDGCTVNQVNILQRHGARYPTLGASLRIRRSLAKFQSATSFASELAWVPGYVYSLGESDLLPFGAAESRDAGAKYFNAYSNLVNDSNLPFVRASGGKRVVESAANWTMGFAIASNYAIRPKIDTIIPECDECRNNTLQDHCPNAPSNKSDYVGAFVRRFFEHTTTRLNSLAPGASLSEDDTYQLMSLCPFDTVANSDPDEDLKLGKFCTLFSKEEWEGYEYAWDLEKYYGTGYGNSLGPAQGIGYIRELMDRLAPPSAKPNSTSSPLNRTMYVDFSHDNLMAAVYSAMGLFREPGPLSTEAIEEGRNWVASRMVPFASRMVVENMDCSLRGWKELYVRVLINDAVQPLEFCGGQEGLCTVDAFASSQAYSLDGQGWTDWEKCWS